MKVALTGAVDPNVGMIELREDGRDHAVLRYVIEFRKRPEDLPTFVEPFVWLQPLHLCNGGAPNQWPDVSSGGAKALLVIVDQEAQLPERPALLRCSTSLREAIPEANR